MINWKIDKHDFEVIRKISKRALSLLEETGLEKPSLMDIEMDITATHLNGCPLKLNELEAAPNADFGHDVFGIRRFLDRNTGKLTGHFCPRYSA